MGPLQILVIKFVIILVSLSGSICTSVSLLSQVFFFLLSFTCLLFNFHFILCDLVHFSQFFFLLLLLLPLLS